MKENISIKNGEVEQSNFHDYEVMRQSDVPPDQGRGYSLRRHSIAGRRTGIGGARARGVANAFLALTGKRLRDLPFCTDRVKATLSKG